MSDSIDEEDTTSIAKLIEVQHVGVTAKIVSPLQNLLTAQTFQSEETDNSVIFINEKSRVEKNYKKFSNSTAMDTETDSTKVLYEMRTKRAKRPVGGGGVGAKMTPAKIEFQLYRKPYKTVQQRKQRRTAQHNNNNNNSHNNKFNHIKHYNKRASESIFKRIFHSFTSLCAYKSDTQNIQKTKIQSKIYTHQQRRPKEKQNSPCLLYEEPIFKHNATQTLVTNLPHTTIGIYQFEQGFDQYMQTTDNHPQVLADALAERTTRMATKFWAQIFGTLHIGVAFFVTFLLQTYRFLLYSLINTLIVGFVRMTTDYMIKPIFTIFYNALLQPIFTLIYQICNALGDMSVPLTNGLNNFLQPFANIVRGLRLIEVKNVQKKTFKEV